MSHGRMTIRNIDHGLKSRLRIRAAENNRSMEEDACDILRTALTAEPMSENLVTAIRRKVAQFGGIDIELPPRSFVGEPIDFGE